MGASFLAGLALSFSLILAIGAQNAFVLRQGLRRSHVFWVCFVCALSDLILITIGVTSFAALSKALPGIERVLVYGGAAFLFWYGARSFIAAWKGGEALEQTEGKREGLRPTLLTVLALTWLNPHCYLDTVMLIGTVSAQYPAPGWFGAGAGLASVLFFFALGYGARLLAPFFASPRAWQVLDVLVGLTMWVLAAVLLMM